MAGAPEQPTDLDAAWEAFFAAARRARSRVRDDDELSLAQYHLLVGLLDEPALPVGELAAGAGVSAPTATRAIDALVRRGVVEREHSAADRRCVIVRLTPAGLTAMRRRRTALRRKRAALFANLDPAEREQAQRLLLRLAGVLDEL